MKHLLMPHGQFFYLTLLGIGLCLETLDFIKHLLPILSTFLVLGEQFLVLLDGNSEQCALVKCILHRGRLLSQSLVEMAKVSTADTALVHIVQYCVSY